MGYYGNPLGLVFLGLLLSGCMPRCEPAPARPVLELEERDSRIKSTTIDIAGGRSVVLIQLEYGGQNHTFTVDAPCDRDRAARACRYIEAAIEEHRGDMYRTDVDEDQLERMKLSPEERERLLELLDPGLRTEYVVGVGTRRVTIPVRVLGDRVFRACVDELRATGRSQLALVVAKIVAAESLPAEDIQAAWGMMEEAWDEYSQWKRETGLNWVGFPAVRFERELGKEVPAGLGDWPEAWKREFSRQGIEYSVSGGSIRITRAPAAPQE